LKTSTRVALAVAVAFVIPTATLTVVLKHERDHSAALAWRQADLCLRTAGMLQIVVEHPPPYALHNWSLHFFDQHLSEFCLGNAVPVATLDAAACWNSTGNHECWRDVFMKLLGLYRVRVHRWEGMRP